MCTASNLDVRDFESQADSFMDHFAESAVHRPIVRCIVGCASLCIANMLVGAVHLYESTMLTEFLDDVAALEGTEEKLRDCGTGHAVGS